MNRSKTLEKIQAHRYNKWTGCPKGIPYDPERCAWEIFGPRVVSYQCTRKNGHGPDGLYCAQHAKMIIERASF